RAVHRCQTIAHRFGIALPCRYRWKLVRRVQRQMTRTNKQLFASHVRRVHQRVAAVEDRVLDKAPQLELEDRTLGMPQDQSRPDVLLDREEVELLAENPVVALLRLLEPPQVRVEVVLGEPRGAVNALQHL